MQIIFLIIFGPIVTLAAIKLVLEMGGYGRSSSRGRRRRRRRW